MAIIARMNSAQTTLRIGCGAGFAGDRLEPALVLATQGALDYLVLECLAERTIALAQLERLKDSERGYDPLLEKRFEMLLPAIKQFGVTVISNLGAANPIAAGRALIALAAKLKLPIKVAVVTGDDVLDRLGANALTMETGKPLSDYPNIVSANAYLGAEALLPAFEAKPDVIITGRVADPSLFLAPMIHHFGWSQTDWERMGRGTAIGHLLECAGQVTGGYFADPGVKDVPGLAHLGFPFAAVDADGSAFISKVPGTGGFVNRQTTTEQLLYEVTDPTAYLTPDVTADFSQVEFHDLGQDRVAVRGAHGKPRPETLKVSVGYRAGWVGEGEISYAGPNARARAVLAGEIVNERLSELAGERLHELRIDLIGINATHRTDFGAGGEPYEVRLRVAGRTDERETAELIGREIESLGTNGPAGGGGFRRWVTEKIGVVSTLIPRAHVQTKVTVMTTQDQPEHAHEAA